MNVHAVYMYLYTANLFAHSHRIIFREVCGRMCVAELLCSLPLAVEAMLATMHYFVPLLIIIIIIIITFNFYSTF